MAITRLSVERGTGGDEHTFNQLMVTQFPEELLGDVDVALFASQLNGGKIKCLAEAGLERPRKIGHRRPITGKMLVHPFEDLCGAIRLLATFP